MKTNNYIVNNIRWLVKDISSDVLKEMLGSIDRGKNCEIVHNGYFKKVLKYTNNQHSFYIKQYTTRDAIDAIKSLFSVTKAHREWNKNHLLLRNNLLTPEPVAVGEKRRFGMLKDCYIISKAIPNSITVKNLLFAIQQAPTHSFEKNILLKNLISYVKIVHERGIFHGELHADNVLVDQANITLFYLLDLGHTEFKKRLTLSMRIRELSRLIYSIKGICTNEEIIELINNYTSQILTSKDEEIFCKAVFNEVSRIKRRLWYGWTSACLKNNNVFRKTTCGIYAVNMRNDWDINIVLGLINQHTISLKKGANNAIKISSKKSITCIPVSDKIIKSVYIKEYRYTSLLKRFLYSLLDSPARKSWFAAHGLMALNFRTPKPIALLEEKRFGVLKKSFIVMEDITSCSPCNKYVSEMFYNAYDNITTGKKRRFVTCLAKSFRQVHDADIYHRDLKANNILIMELPDTWDFFYLDLDHVSFNKKITLKKSIKNLSQLNASLPNCITYTDRLRFYRAYTGAENLDSENKQILRAIVQLSMRRKHIWNPKTRIVHSEKNKKVYFLIQGWEHPASRYRVLQYVPYLKESHTESKVALFPDSFCKWMKLFSKIQDYDIIFIQKKRLWHWQLWYLRRKHIKIIYDFDDAVMFKSPVDGGGKSFKRERTFARMVRYSGLVIAGNQYLKIHALPYNKNIIIIPTAIDTSKYTMKDYGRNKEKVTIGWIGSKSSLPFLKELTPAFDHLANHHDNIELKIICSDFFDCEKMPLIKKPWAMEDENSDLQDIDIGLAPLPNHEWTKGKCATKLLQYLSVGTPVVCSPVGVHNEIIQEGVNGLFAASIEEWIEKINLLIKDNNLRKRMGFEGRKTVESFYSLKANSPKFIEVIEGTNIKADNLPLVSIILPTYNCADFLPYSIESILSQTYDSYEIIVVDDGSTDNTKEVLCPFMQRIKYIKLEQNKGPSTARNTGIKSAQGKYIAFIDADDLWLPEKLQTNIEYFRTHPEVSMGYSKYLDIDEKGKVMNTPKRRLLSGNVFTQLFFKQNFVTTSSVVVLREVFKTTGLFNEQLSCCEDWDMWLRIAFHFKVAGINKLLVKYRHNPRSLTKNRNNILKYQKVVIDKTYNEFKGEQNGISEKLYKKRLASHYAKAGRYYLRIGNKSQANENFQLSLKYRPLNMRTLRNYFLTFYHKSKTQF